MYQSSSHLQQMISQLVTPGDNFHQTGYTTLPLFFLQMLEISCMKQTILQHRNKPTEVTNRCFSCKIQKDMSLGVTIQTKLVYWQGTWTISLNCPSYEQCHEKKKLSVESIFHCACQASSSLAEVSHWPRLHRLAWTYAVLICCNSSFPKTSRWFTWNFKTCFPWKK